MQAFRTAVWKKNVRSASPNNFAAFRSSLFCVPNWNASKTRHTRIFATHAVHDQDMLWRRYYIFPGIAG
jgi:hypothetical protein